MHTHRCMICTQSTISRTHKYTARTPQHGYTRMSNAQGSPPPPTHQHTSTPPIHSSRESASQITQSALHICPQCVLPPPLLFFHSFFSYPSSLLTWRHISRRCLPLSLPCYHLNHLKLRSTSHPDHHPDLHHPEPPYRHRRHGPDRLCHHRPTFGFLRWWSRTSPYPSSSRPLCVYMCIHMRIYNIQETNHEQAS